jgi:hypothetical protein
MIFGPSGGAGGLNVWATGTVYAADEVVLYGDKIYRCLGAHTAAATFQQDYLALTRWMLVSTWPTNYLSDATGQDQGKWTTYALTNAVTFQDTGDTVTLASHGLSTGNTLSFSVITTTTGISINTTYYAIYVSSSTFQVASSLANAQAGTALALTTNGSGTLLKSIPVDGTGGSATVTYLKSSSDFSLRNSFNFVFTHQASNRMGEGFTYDFGIDNADKGKVLQCSFEYSIASGVYADDDLQFWIYDVTNSALIQPAPFKLKNSGIVERFAFEFQTSSSSTSYRLIGHVATSTATAYTIRFDNWNCGPQAKLYGSAITDWVTTWTPTGTLTTNVTYTGKWRRVGDSIEIEGTIAFGGLNSQGVANIVLPNGLQIDTTKLTALATARAVLGKARIYDSSTDQGYDATAVLDSASGGIRFSRGDTTAGSICDTSANRPITFAINDTISFHAFAPIVGWSSSQVMSSDADTRVVAASAPYTSAGGGTVPASFTNVPFTNVSTTHGNWANDQFTVLVPGWYSVDAQVEGTKTSFAAGDYIQVSIDLDSTALAYDMHKALATATSLHPHVSHTFYANAGQIIKIKAKTNAATVVYAVSDVGNRFSISRIAGPAQIAASETVAGRYYGATATVTGTDSLVTFSTKDNDSHGCYSSGTLSIPSSGRYQFSANMIIAATYALGNSTLISIYKNGVQVSQSGVQAGGINTSLVVNVNDTIRCLANDTITIQVSSNGTTPTVSASNVRNYFSWNRVGNY